MQPSRWPEGNGARSLSSCKGVRRFLSPRGRVQLSVIAINILYAVIGVVLMYVSYRLIDRLTPEVDFPAELQRGNVAVAIFIAAIFVSIALIIGKALG